MSTYNPNLDAHYQILREMLIEARQSKGWFQKDVAKLLQRSQAFVSKYESGERTLDWVEVLYLLELFEVTETKFTQEFRKRVVQFNDSTEAAVLRKVAARERKSKVQQEISRLAHEHGLTPADLKTAVLPSKKRDSIKKS
ncbi:helix-turn-helix transcriptional regulator [Duganella sp. BJB476]|uniref:helix-turn-helix domain-containing protein n=1 Tax=Duganella sp. BJB476 TaxID=1871176 RepID=UPI000E351520|nr:helix-turn-helix transcriptional regulator [Duganella sp. BJB476]RFP28720.1 XRE family transcriptional regulator [Duganella sp. BJB476]